MNLTTTFIIATIITNLILATSVIILSKTTARATKVTRETLMQIALEQEKLAKYKKAATAYFKRDQEIISSLKQTINQSHKGDLS